MQILNQYENGNVLTTLYVDGTRERLILGGSPVFNFPENIDVKITNYCDMDNVCLYCHEKSNKLGVHGNLNNLLTKLEGLPAGVELAIGGGSTTSHPNLTDFLVAAKLKGFICNLTVNQLHLKQDDKLIENLINNDLIKGVGISYRSDYNRYLLKYAQYEHTVIHLIAGIDDYSVINSLYKLGFRKFLVLGYKTFGNGTDYYNENKQLINRNIQMWKMKIAQYFNTDMIISFDNLAINQLNIKRFLSNTEWDLFYQGDDFTCSMYIDAVEETFAPTSRSAARVKFKETSLFEYFNKRTKFIETTDIN